MTDWRKVAADAVSGAPQQRIASTTKHPIALARRHYIGGSDVSAVLGISPYTTPVELYLRKRGEAEPQPDAPQLRRGRRLEPYVVDMYKDDTRRHVDGPAFVIGSEPWMCGQLDGTSGPGTVGGVDRVLEVKTANQWTRKDWGEEGTDAIPVYYTAQVQWYLGITKFQRADVAALIGIDDFRIYTVEADAVLQTMLVARAREFWQRVQDGRPPEPVSTEDVALLFPQHAPGSVVEANDVDLARLAMLRNFREQIKAAQAEEAALLMQLQRTMGAAEALVVDETPVCTWRTQETTRVDVKALRAAHPDVAEAFEKVGKSRVFRLK